MHLAYLDASGTPELQDRTTHYVLACTVLHESAWEEFERLFLELAASYQFSTAVPIEFHAKEIFARISEQGAIPNFSTLSRDQRRAAVLTLRAQAISAQQDEKKRKDLVKIHRNTDPFIHLTFEERWELYNKILHLISTTDSITLLAYAIDKHFNFRMHGQADVAESAFMQVVSRFDYLVQRSNREKRVLDRGLLVLDEDGSREPYIRKLTAKYRDIGHAYGSLLTIIEAPFFVESSVSIGVQVADVVSYAVRRYLEHQGGAKEIASLGKLWNKFDKENGTIHGLRHYCPVTCDCLICAETKRTVR